MARRADAAEPVLSLELSRASRAWFRHRGADHRLRRVALAQCFEASESTGDRGGHCDIYCGDRAAGHGHRTHARRVCWNDHRRSRTCFARNRLLVACGRAVRGLVALCCASALWPQDSLEGRCALGRRRRRCCAWRDGASSVRASRQREGSARWRALLRALAGKNCDGGIHIGELVDGEFVLPRVPPRCGQFMVALGAFREFLQQSSLHRQRARNSTEGFRARTQRSRRALLRGMPRSSSILLR